jgi:hypothetical protein
MQINIGDFNILYNIETTTGAKLDVGYSIENDFDSYFVGRRAKARIILPYGKDYIEKFIETPGIWGIDSDADKEYLSKIIKCELEVLLVMLTALADSESTTISKSADAVLN